MQMRSWLRRGLVIGVLATTLAFSAVPTVLAAPVVLATESAIKRVTDGRNSAYLQVLAEFDAAVGAAPDDAELAVARCRFVWEFAEENYGQWIDAATAEFQVCSSAIASRWPSEPVAQMFALDQLWGAEAIDAGEALLEGAQGWPDRLRRQLLTKLSSMAHDQGGDQGRAGELAVMSVRLGENAIVARAVDHLVGLKDFASAAALLRDAPPASDVWEAGARVEAALELPDPGAAVTELKRHTDAGLEIEAAIAARAHLRAGEIAVARGLLQSADGGGEALQEARFDAAMAAGDFGAAAALVDSTDFARLAVNAQRFAALAVHAPRSLATPTMLMAALAYFMLLVAIALVPGMVFVPVHYRGLVRRVRGKPASPVFASIGLRHAWIAGAVMLCAPIVAAAVVEPGSLAVLLAGQTTPGGEVIFRVSLWGSVFGLLLLGPVIRHMGLRTVLGDRAMLLEWWRVLLAWACLMVIGVVLQAWHGQSGVDTSTLQTRTVDALAAGGRDAYGAMTTLLVTALLVPVFEELIFRGLILGGLTRHISFGWANTLQAALFAAIHDDPPRFLFYFALGLFAGWLVKRNRSLAPAIALHAVNNAFAFSLRMLV